MDIVQLIRKTMVVQMPIELLEGTDIVLKPTGPVNNMEVGICKDSCML